MQARIASLTGIRGYAALWVVLMHYTWGSPRGGGEDAFNQFGYHGFAGVIIFLVLSGFIMSYVHQEFAGRLTRQNLLDYFAKRFARVYPLHVAALLGYALLLTIGFIVASPNDTAINFVWNLLLVQAWGVTNEFSWNAPAWTLSVEMFAYLFFPVLAYGLLRAPAWLNGFIAILCIAFVWCAPYASILKALGIARTDVVLDYGNYLVLFCGMFISGVALFNMMRATVNRPGWVDDLLMLAGLGMLGYACTVPVHSGLLMLGALLLIAGLSRDHGIGRRLFGNRVAVFLGDVSYALYLTHVMVHAVLANLSLHFPLVIEIAAAVAAATAIHYGYEKPMRFYLRRQWRAHGHKGN